jgi:hypothetical protein
MLLSCGAVNSYVIKIRKGAYFQYLGWRLMGLELDGTFF